MHVNNNRKTNLSQTFCCGSVFVSWLFISYNKLEYTYYSMLQPAIRIRVYTVIY